MVCYVFKLFVELVISFGGNVEVLVIEGGDKRVKEEKVVISMLSRLEQVGCSIFIGFSRDFKEECGGQVQSVVSGVEQIEKVDVFWELLFVEFKLDFMSGMVVVEVEVVLFESLE